MAYAHRSFQVLKCTFFKDICDKAHSLMSFDPTTITDDYPGGFLAAMLKSIQAQVYQARRIFGAAACTAP